MDESMILERLVKVEARASAMADRIEDIERKVEDVHRLTTAVELIAQRTATIEQKQDAFGVQLQELREAPGKRAVSLKTTIITAAASAIVSVLVGALLALIIK